MYNSTIAYKNYISRASFSVLNKHTTRADIVSVLSKEGSSVSLECHLGDVNEQSSVKWMKDGSQVLLEHDDDARRRFKVETRKHFMLTILQVSSDDAGLYDCVQFGEQDQFKIKSARRYRLMVNGWLTLCITRRKITLFSLYLISNLAVEKILSLIR